MPSIFETRFNHLDYIDLFPIADLHIGAGQCDEKMIEHLVFFIKKNPQAYWFFLGDINNNNISGSAGTPYEDIMPPRKQIQRAVDLFYPIKEKGWGVIAGNHNHRTRRAVGLDPDEWLARDLNIPFWGDSAFLYIVIKNKAWSFYAHHCTGGGYTAGGKANATNNLRDITPCVDFILGAHVHSTQHIPTRYVTIDARSPNKKQKIVIKTRRGYQCGSALHWEGSYAETKAKPPAMKELIWLRLKGLTGGKDGKTIGHEMFEHHIFSG